MASRRVEDLDPRIQSSVRELLNAANKLTYPWTTFITDGFRSRDEQAKLYAQGRTSQGKIVTNAKPGTSNHEKGLAVDIAFQKDGKLSYDTKFYNMIVPIADALGFSWGGRWSRFIDKPHFEKLRFNKPSVPELVITDQTRIDLGKPIGVMEVQAIRSTINDQARDIINLNKSIKEQKKVYKLEDKVVVKTYKRLNKTIDNLEDEILDLEEKLRIVTTPPEPPPVDSGESATPVSQIAAWIRKKLGL